MIGNISQLESVINLESVGLFLNSFDVTNAFMDIYSSDALFKFVKTLCLKRPYKDFKVKNYRQLNSSRRSAFVAKEIVNKDILSIIKVESDLNKLFMQSLVDYLVSKPLIMQSNPTYNPDYIENQPDIIKYIEQPSTEAMLYRSLTSFYKKASVKFEEFNNFSYEDFVKSLSDGLLNEVKEKRSAFGLYLLSHTDIRINFLSQFFISRNSQSVLDSFPMIEVRETAHIFSDYDEILRYISERVNNGNQLLSKMDLRIENNYQPKEGESLGLVKKSILGYTCLENKVDEINSQTKRITEKLDTKMDELKEICTSHTLEKRELDSRIKELENKVFCLTKEQVQTPKVKTSKDYQSLEKTNDYLSGKIRENNHKIRSLKKSKSNSKLKTEKLEEQVRRLEGKISSLNNNIDELSIIPELKEFYEDKNVLVIVSLPKQFDVYKREANKIFNEHKIVLYDKTSQQKSTKYDLVVLVAGLAGHCDRWLLEKRNGKKKVMLYTSKPNQLLRKLHTYINNSNKN